MAALEICLTKTWIQAIRPGRLIRADPRRLDANRGLSCQSVGSVNRRGYSGSGRRGRARGWLGIDQGLQPFGRHMGVDLGGGDVGMAQHLLQRAQVGAMVQQVGREGVAQHMGRDPARIDVGRQRRPPSAAGRSAGGSDARCRRGTGTARARRRRRRGPWPARRRAPADSRRSPAAPRRSAAPSAPCRPCRGRPERADRASRRRAAGRPAPTPAGRWRRAVPGAQGRAARHRPAVRGRRIAAAPPPPR